MVEQAPVTSEDIRPTCFVAMPISTPEQLVPQYRDDTKHFAHVLECLIHPALTEAGFKVVEPSMQRGEFIHAEVIKNLEECDLVLCDISTLNANVFMELGIRTALNRPIALIRDELTRNVPFDTQVIGYHVYNSNLAQWVIRDEIPKLGRFAKSVLEKSEGKNALWRHLGITRTATGEVNGNWTQESHGVILKELQNQRESYEDPLVRVMQKIVELARRHRVVLLWIKWQGVQIGSRSGEFEVLIAPPGDSVYEAFKQGLDEIRQQFDAKEMRLLVD